MSFEFKNSGFVLGRAKNARSFIFLINKGREKKFRYFKKVLIQLFNFLCNYIMNVSFYFHLNRTWTLF